MRARMAKLTILVLAATFVLSGCTIAKISGRGAMPIILNNPPKKVQVIKHIKTSKMINFDYTSSFDVSEVLNKAIEGENADAIINCTITLKSTVANFFVNLITLGIASSKTFQIEGDLIKAPEGLGSLDPSGQEPFARAATPDGLEAHANVWTPANGTLTLAKAADGFALVGGDAGK